jgi:hypothetical protein
VRRTSRLSYSNSVKLKSFFSSKVSYYNYGGKLSDE